jgi:hypothetical protein
MARLEEWIADLPRQYAPPKWLIGVTAVAVFVAFAGLGGVLGYRFFELFDYPDKSTGRSVTGILALLIAMVPVMTGFWQAMNVPDRFAGFWPVVEMRTGRDSESPEEPSRRKLRFVWVEIAIPLALMVLGLAIPPLLK